MWRVGSKVKINVYDGDRPVCQCHSERDAMLIAVAVEYYLSRFAPPMNDIKSLREVLQERTVEDKS